MKIRSIYLIGSLRNPKVQTVAQALRKAGYVVFDEWQSPGPDADDHWQKYERARGRGFKAALNGAHAQMIFNLDRQQIEKHDVAVMVAPCGKSGHLELGYKVGRGEPGFILMEGEPERYDIMYGFATDIFFSLDELVEGLRVYDGPVRPCGHEETSARSVPPNRKRGTV
jgi:nucleoside 2-deoxyribosyltransferase